jgi:hypothetical protein
MQFKTILLSMTLLLTSLSVNADLVPWKDYDTSDAVWNVTTVRVNANMGDAYLEGLKNTWVASNKIAIELGQIEEYKMYRSDLPQSGDFNLLLIVKFKDTNDLAPSKKNYEAFMKKWGEKRNKETTEYAQKNYPAMRTITGSYNMREITLK